ncbi:MAG: type III-B CRISPR-associated protein Cas10/Cmr2 [Candidatus Aenigmatarchaeota archaeon]
MNKPHLFLFTIGPVQSFIAQARKTQDLYTGSFILSYLIDKSMEKLKNQLNNKCDFIFPSQNLKTKPNRFIAKIESNNIEQLGNEIRKYTEDEFRSISYSILSEIVNIPGNDFKNEFDKHINSFLNIYWVALPLGESNYEEIYGEIENYLGAVKNVRNFKQINIIGHKCSLCGVRNGIFYKEPKRSFLFEHSVKLQGIPLRYLKKGENLCAIGFIKRFAGKKFDNYDSNFPSVSRIALLNVLNKINENALNKYKNYFLNSFNEELFYEENLTEKYFDDNNIPVEKLNDAKVKLDELKKLLPENYKFGKYYAVLLMDGDDMGRWLSGEYLKDKTQLYNFHKFLSEKLGGFADSVSKIVDDKIGKLVYSGGDDVLAFLNIHNIFPVIKKLRKSFPDFGIGSFDTEGKKSSASAGIVIAHYKTPLSEVIKAARNIEKEAKSIQDKNAWAIGVQKRSGGARLTVFKWGNKNSDLIDSCLYTLKVLKEKSFSNNFIRNLEIEFGHTLNNKHDNTESEIHMNELRRLISRSCMLLRKDGESQQEYLERKKREIKGLFSNLSHLYENSNSFSNFIDLLHIIDFIARGGN